MASESPGNAGANPARCVLLHEPEARAPEPLLSALVRRNIEVSACTSPHRAMAMLCALAGRDDDAPLILLLVNGESIRLAAALVDAVEMYVPIATIWVFEDHGTAQLRAVERSDLERWSRRRVPQAEHGAIEPKSEPKPGDWPGPSLKLVEDGPFGDDPTEPEPPGPSGGGSIGGNPHSTAGIAPSARTAGGAQGPSFSDPPASESAVSADRDDSAGRSMDGPVSLTDDELSMLLADDWTDPGRS